MSFYDITIAKEAFNHDGGSAPKRRTTGPRIRPAVPVEGRKWVIEKATSWELQRLSRLDEALCDGWPDEYLEFDAEKFPTLVPRLHDLLEATTQSGYPINYRVRADNYDLLEAFFDNALKTWKDLRQIRD